MQSVICLVLHCNRVGFHTHVVLTKLPDPSQKREYSCVCILIYMQTHSMHATKIKPFYARVFVFWLAVVRERTTRRWREGLASTLKCDLYEAGFMLVKHEARKTKVCRCSTLVGLCCDCLHHVHNETAAWNSSVLSTSILG